MATFHLTTNCKAHPALLAAAIDTHDTLVALNVVTVAEVGIEPTGRITGTFTVDVPTDTRHPVTVATLDVLARWAGVVRATGGTFAQLASSGENAY